MLQPYPWQREPASSSPSLNAASPPPPLLPTATPPTPAAMTAEMTSAATETAEVLLPEFFYPGARELRSLHDWYVHLHGYLATVVCLFGIVANLLNIVVLTRRNMVSPTNCILTALALSDGLTMAAYLPFALRFYVLYGIEPTPERNSLPAVRFMLFYACFSVVVHTVSIWLTVTLAIFRYVFIRYPRQGSQWCSLRRAKLSVFLVNLVTLVVCVPNFVTIRVQSDGGVHWPPLLRYHGNSSATDVIWNVEFKEDTPGDVIVKNLNFWIQALLVKLVPCVGLTILSLLLVRTMKVAERRRRKLRKCNTGSSTAKEEGASSRDRKTNRTTRMLLVVVVLFLMTEFPQGVLNLLSGIASTDFVTEVYMTLGDLLDILTLVNNGVNFILYCTMSKQFRDTFLYVFLPFGTSGRMVKVTTSTVRTTIE